jgi:hypothetical protein
MSQETVVLGGLGIAPMLRVPGPRAAAAGAEVGALAARHIRQGQGRPTLEEGGALPDAGQGVFGEVTQDLSHTDTGPDGPVRRDHQTGGSGPAEVGRQVRSLGDP